MGNSEQVRRVVTVEETAMPYRPSPIEFELAYQSRLAIERIRFAISQIEIHLAGQSRLFETSLQLADALDRLESADRHFHKTLRSRSQITINKRQSAPIGNSSNSNVGLVSAAQRNSKNLGFL